MKLFHTKEKIVLLHETKIKILFRDVQIYIILPWTREEHGSIDEYRAGKKYIPTCSQLAGAENYNYNYNILFTASVHSIYIYLRQMNQKIIEHVFTVYNHWR